MPTEDQPIRAITMTCSEWMNGPKYTFESHFRLVGDDAAFDWIVDVTKSTQERARGIYKFDVREYDGDETRTYEIYPETVPGCRFDMVDFGMTRDNVRSTAFLLSQRDDDPMDDYLGVDSAGMIAELRAKKGLCVECGINSCIDDDRSFGGMCFVCSVRTNRESAEAHEQQDACNSLYEQRSAAGICVSCGARPPADGDVNCAACIASEDAIYRGVYLGPETDKEKIEPVLMSGIDRHKREAAEFLDGIIDADEIEAFVDDYFAAFEAEETERQRA